MIENYFAFIFHKKKKIFFFPPNLPQKFKIHKIISPNIPSFLSNKKKNYSLPKITLQDKIFNKYFVANIVGINPILSSIRVQNYRANILILNY